MNPHTAPELLRKMLVTFFSVRRFGEVVGADVTVEVPVGTIRLTPRRLEPDGSYKAGTMRIEGVRRGLGFGGVKLRFERADFRFSFISGVLVQGAVGQEGMELFGGIFQPKGDSVPAAYVDPSGRVFDIGLLPRDLASVAFVPTEGFWLPGAQGTRFQNRRQGIGERSSGACG